MPSNFILGGLFMVFLTSRREYMSPFLSPYLFHPRPCNICERTFSDKNTYKFQVRLLSFFNHIRPPHGTLPPQSPPSARPNNPWQAQWANKHVADHLNGRPEDVFKCVWCKESYATFEQLTVHIREAKHHSIPNQHFGPPTSFPSSLLPEDVFK